MRPTAFTSPVCAMPTMMVETSSGTISPLMRLMKAFEKNWNSWKTCGCSFCGKNPPSKIPIARPMKIQKVPLWYRGFFDVASAVTEAMLLRQEDEPHSDRRRHQGDGYAHSRVTPEVDPAARLRLLHDDNVR